MDLEDILFNIRAEPKNVREDRFGKSYFFEFYSRQQFNVNGFIVRCEKLYVSNFGMEFHFKDGEHGRHVYTHGLGSIKSFYHYFDPY